jgi:hypothetical protein
VTTKDKKSHTIFDAMSLVASLTAGSDGVMLADGTLWSHAATLGTRVKGEEFSIDRTTVENFVKVFTTGYPQKVPVDYDHASTSSDPEIRKLRAQGKVPKAGDVYELRGVFAAADFTGELKAAAEKLSAQARPPRALDDARNYGLWMRWKPTAQALAAIKAGEYSELSITFDEDWPDNTTGAGQGPAIVAVALTNLPFLDDMLPVAASRHDPHDPAAAPDAPSDSPSTKDRAMTKLTVLSVVAAMLSKPVATEEEAITELTALQPEITKMREFRSVIGAELGEQDAVKAVAKIRELKAAEQTAKDEASKQKKAAIKTQVEATLKKYENRLTVPLRTMMANALTVELEADKKLEETETVKTLESLKPTGITGSQTSQADAGTDGLDDDELLDAKAKELIQSDPEVKELHQKEGFTKAFRFALTKADKLLGATKS